MTFDSFLSAISFRFVKPTSGLRWYHRFSSRLCRFGVSLEIVNTILPNDRVRERRTLQRLCMMPRMSTYAIGAIVDKAVSCMPEGCRFVNVGAWHGFTFLAGIVSNMNRPAVCVDNFSQFGGPRNEFLSHFRAVRGDCHDFFDMDYRDYFASVHYGPIGVYLYDGEHSYANQLRSLELAEPFFVPGTIVIVDDTNEPEPRKATLDFLASKPGRYAILRDEQTSCNGHPTFWNGLMVIEKKR